MAYKKTYKKRPGLMAVYVCRRIGRARLLSIDYTLEEAFVAARSIAGGTRPPGQSSLRT